MPECPACFGDGRHDMRDSDAIASEHLPERVLRYLRTRPGWMGFVECAECEGTGVVSPERHAEMRSEAAAYVARIRAIAEAEEERT